MTIHHDLHLGERVRINPDLRKHGNIVGTICALNCAGESDKDRRRWAKINQGDGKPLLLVQYRELLKVE